jgi:hypothetical protein
VVRGRRVVVVKGGHMWLVWIETILLTDIRLLLSPFQKQKLPSESAVVGECRRSETLVITPNPGPLHGGGRIRAEVGLYGGTAT